MGICTHNLITEIKFIKQRETAIKKDKYCITHPDLAHACLGSPFSWFCDSDRIISGNYLKVFVINNERWKMMQWREMQNSSLFWVGWDSIRHNSWSVANIRHAYVTEHTQRTEPLSQQPSNLLSCYVCMFQEIHITVSFWTMRHFDVYLYVHYDNITIASKNCLWIL